MQVVHKGDFGPIIDQAVTVAVQDQEAIVAADPTGTLGRTIAIHVEPGFAMIDGD